MYSIVICCRRVMCTSFSSTCWLLPSTAGNLNDGHKQGHINILEDLMGSMPLCTPECCVANKVFCSLKCQLQPLTLEWVVLGEIVKTLC